MNKSEKELNIIGFDPGKNGAYCIMKDGDVVMAEPLPFIGDELDIETIKFMMMEYANGPRRAVLEKVHAMPGQGVCSMFTFGKNYGELRGMLKALAIPFDEPTPQQWKKKVLEGTAKDKTAAIEYVTRRYPDVDLKPGRKKVPHDGIADAVCLAEFGTY